MNWESGQFPTLKNTVVYFNESNEMCIGRSSGVTVVGHFLLWERYSLALLSHSITYRYRGGGGGA